VKPEGEPGGLVPFSQKWKLEINYDVEIDV
jgi:hypothetical protein